MMVFRKRFLAVLATIVCLAPSLVRSADNPYPIDVILPITGPGAYAGTTIQKVLTALEGVVNKSGGIQGRPVHFAFHDDQTNPAVSLELATQIVPKKPAVVLGPVLGALCNATQPLFVNGPVDYCLSPVISPQPNGYVFSAHIAGTDLLLASMRYLRGRGWKRIATLNSTDSSGQIGDRDVATNLKLPELQDMTLVAAEHFNPADTSVTAQVAKIKAANPQAIIVWAPGTPFGTALHGLQDVGLDIPVVTTSANMVVNQLKLYSPFMPKSVYFQGTAYIAGNAPPKPNKGLQVFAAAMKEAGIPQDGQGGLPWDPAMIVIDALRKLGPNATADQLRTYINNLHDYAGIIGTYDFRGGNQRGTSVQDINIMRWDPEKTDFVGVSKPGGYPL